jgi:hypothetical protein
MVRSSAVAASAGVAPIAVATVAGMAAATVASDAPLSSERRDGVLVICVPLLVRRGASRQTHGIAAIG